MKKYILLILILIISWSCWAWAENKLYVFGDAAVLSGFYVINKATGERIGYIAVGTSGEFEMTIELELVPVYIADGDEPPPDPTWVPTKENAFQTSCNTCHSQETEDKFEFEKWKTNLVDWTNDLNAPNDDGHKKHMKIEKPVACTACHRRI